MKKIVAFLITMLLLFTTNINAFTVVIEPSENSISEILKMFHVSQEFYCAVSSKKKNKKDLKFYFIYDNINKVKLHKVCRN